MRQYAVVIGLFVLALVVIFLLSSPQDLLTTAYFIDTELATASGSETPIRVKMDLGKQEQLNALPLHIGQWSGMELDAAAQQELLGADVMLTRSYKNASTQLAVFLLVMQSSSTSSFHPPPICYTALGYEIEEQDNVEVPVRNASWAEEPFFSGWISAKKLVVSKAGETVDRRVVLYFYIKDRAFTSDKISLLRTSALAPPAGPYDAALAHASALMGEVVPLMFEPHQEGEMFIVYLADWGAGGCLLIAGLLAIPLALIVYPLAAARRGAAGKGRRKR